MSSETTIEFCEDGGHAAVTTTTYRPYTDYRITETTYAGKSQQVKDQTTREERVYGTPYTATTGECS